MASATKSESIAGRLISRFLDRLGRIRCAFDIRGLSASQVESIAHDLHVSRAELETLVAHGRQGADELSKLLKAVGIDGMAIARKEPGVLRDITLVCALCVAKSRCNLETEAGTAARHHHEYCANSYIIDALKRKPKYDSRGCQH